MIPGIYVRLPLAGPANASTEDAKHGSSKTDPHTLGPPETYADSPGGTSKYSTAAAGNSE